MGVPVTFLDNSAPPAAVKMLDLIVPGVEREEVRRVGKVQQSDMAYVQLAPPGQQRQAQGVLVVVRDEPALDGVAHRLPPLVVLIENVAALAPGVLVDHQQRPVEKRQLAPLRLVLIQQSADGVAESLRGLEPAVGQQGVQLDMEPAELVHFHFPGSVQRGQRRLLADSGNRRQTAFA